MSDTRGSAARRYKIRRSSGEIEYVDRNELARLQMARAERFRRARERRRLLALAVGLVVMAGVVAAVLWVLPEGAGVPANAAPAATPSESPVDATAAPAAESASDPATHAAPAAPEERVARTVRDWAQAWSEQDVLRYLGTYAEEFRPADGSERREWARGRRLRLLLPESVEVEVSDLEVELLGDGRARARFLQGYRSPDYADRVRKTLELVDVAGQWRIVAELAEPAG